MLPSYREALARVLSEARMLPSETVPTLEALGRILAADVVAAASSPGFDNSAMDGYAIRAADTKGASLHKPARLDLRGSAAAGEVGGMPALGAGQAIEIMTGARVPFGATTVIPVEMTERDGDSVLIAAAYPENRNIRRLGSDFAAGNRLFCAGRKIDTVTIPALAAAGVPEVTVSPKPKILWISTGRELVDMPGAKLLPGQIYNSSGPFGAAAVEQAEVRLVGRLTVGDDGESFCTALQEILAGDGVDVIVSTGAVSVGRYDFVRAELERLGARILLHRAKVKPGKPVLFALLPGGKYFFGLPGNPVSTAMAFRMFVTPLLRALGGFPPELPVSAILKEDVTATKDLTVFLKGRVEILPTCIVAATALAGQESFKIGSMADMNCWIVHPEGVETLVAGTRVACFPIQPDAWPVGGGCGAQLGKAAMCACSIL